MLAARLCIGMYVWGVVRGTCCGAAEYQVDSTGDPDGGSCEVSREMRRGRWGGEGMSLRLGVCLCRGTE